MSLQLAPVRSIPVEFNAEAADRVGPLTWCQQAIMGRLLNEYVEPSAMTTSRCVRVEGLPLKRALDCIRQLVERFEALRTSITIGDPREVRQRALRTGFVEVDVYDVPLSADDEQSLQVVREVGLQLAEVAGQQNTQSLVKFALLTETGETWGVLFCISYLAADATAANALERALRGLITEGRLPDRPGYDWHPIDQASYEGSADGQKIQTRAAAHWLRCFESGMNRLFPSPRRHSAEPKLVEFDMHSYSLTGALARLAQKHAVSESVIALTATSLVLRDMCGTDRVLLELIFHNRWDEEKTDSVCALAQNSAFFAELGRSTFSELVPIVARKALRAYRYSHHNSTAVQAMLEERFGDRLDRSGFFSFLPAPAQGWSPKTSMDESATLAPTTSVEVIRRTQSAGTKFFLNVNEGKERHRFRLFAHTDFLPESDAESFLLRLETLTLSESAKLY